MIRCVSCAATAAVGAAEFGPTMNVVEAMAAADPANKRATRGAETGIFMCICFLLPQFFDRV
jgi:hypothetical protein